MTTVRGLVFPDELFYLVARHTWAQPLPDGTVRAGITSLGAALAGELMGFVPKSLGMVIEQGRAMGVVELAKVASSVRSPVTGRVVLANEAAREDPALINRDPYGAGWLVVIEPADWARDKALLLSGREVAAAMEAAMVLERFGESHGH